MNNHQYLTDGLLESYVLGTLSPASKEHAALLIDTDPDISLQLEELETGMEDYFLQHAVPPPTFIKKALQERLVGQEIKKWEEPRVRQESPRSEPSRPAYVDVEVSDTHIRVHKNWRAAFIAVFVLSKIFLAFAMYQYFKSSSLADEVARLKATQQTTAPLPHVAP